MQTPAPLTRSINSSALLFTCVFYKKSEQTNWIDWLSLSLYFCLRGFHCYHSTNTVERSTLVPRWSFEPQLYPSCCEVGQSARTDSPLEPALRGRQRKCSGSVILDLCCQLTLIVASSLLFYLRLFYVVQSLLSGIPLWRDNCFV